MPTIPQCSQDAEGSERKAVHTPPQITQSRAFTSFQRSCFNNHRRAQRACARQGIPASSPLPSQWLDAERHAAASKAVANTSKMLLFACGAHSNSAYSSPLGAIQRSGATGCHSTWPKTAMVAWSGPVTRAQCTPPRRTRGIARAHAVFSPVRCMGDERAQSRIHNWTGSREVATAGSRLLPRRHARSVVVQG